MTRSTPDGSWSPDPAEFELGTDGHGTVVVGVDGSPTSHRALAYAAGQARRQHGRLVVVYVRSHAGGCGFEAGLVNQADMATAALVTQEEIAAELRAEVAHLARAWHVAGTLVLGTGDPAKELAKVADREHADHVVVGSSTRLGHRLAGSIAIRLVRNCGWPVTVVP
ncbi:universal stress protein A [Actinomycetospora sp. NBRC 106375]|uniref:universal stress protein n=1 Tax=Actinomycetospora sp. NBRC 106375 TaxID=3032207 RepID=UPI0024A5890C|nr:universal stress protein [Actinomycetospora sp. NBRC 106375]GLZ48113.1 universal stress protein A [Actinomycetospora sp. NBRC 106375]